MNTTHSGAGYEAAVNMLERAYDAFNARNIDAVLHLMHPDVAWPNGWEGGYVHGHDEVRAYWQRQWAVINPHVSPASFLRLPDGRIRVDVHQQVEDLQGNPIIDDMIQHIYTIENGLIRTMEIEPLS